MSFNHSEKPIPKIMLFLFCCLLAIGFISGCSRRTIQVNSTSRPATSSSNSSAAKRITVPDLVGLIYNSSTKAKLEAEGFKVKEDPIDTESSNIQINEILKLTPSTGKVVAKGTEITVTYSQNAKPASSTPSISSQSPKDKQNSSKKVTLTARLDSNADECGFHIKVGTVTKNISDSTFTIPMTITADQDTIPLGANNYYAPVSISYAKELEGPYTIIKTAQKAIGIDGYSNNCTIYPIFQDLTDGYKKPLSGNIHICQFADGAKVNDDQSFEFSIYLKE